ncbi:helix-turn-helix transcriptional regulator [Microbacterium sp. X-17]|uniref:helix-turn-helix domain-containing protein n=1 Tax=Microbacterium sp. X-17 TaxID=3144404 RepID=UPI0031F4DD0F
MAGFRSEGNIGARIKLARKERGFRTTRDLADAIPGGNVTQAILENIESGRKADISITQLLNIARGLGVPISMLLAPIGTPDAELDLPNLSDDFAGMTAAEFDCWLSATPASSYRPRVAAERVDIDILTSLRELGSLRREIDRLRIVVETRKASRDRDLIETNHLVQKRLDRIAQDAASVASLLENAGLELPQDDEES